jgi:hypothetical protein
MLLIKSVVADILSFKGDDDLGYDMIVFHSSSDPIGRGDKLYADKIYDTSHCEEVSTALLIK